MHACAYARVRACACARGRCHVSKAVPHFTPEWLDEYRRKLADGGRAPAETAQNPARTPAHAHATPQRAMTPYAPSESAEVPLRASGGKQTDTEKRYNRDVLGGKGRFEAVTLRLPGGGRYTPDFMTIDDGRVTFHEVKGSYRLGSQGRAFTAFHDAAAYYPMWRFVWARWTGKAWKRETVE